MRTLIRGGRADTHRRRLFRRPLEGSAVQGPAKGGERGGDGADGGDEWLVARPVGSDGIDEGVVLVVEHDVFSGGEVAVEGGRRCLGRFGDLLDGGVLVALGEEAERLGLDGATQLDLVAFPQGIVS